MSRRKKPRKQTETQKQQQLLQKIHVDIPVDYELLAKEILKQQALLEKAKENVEETDTDTEPEKLNIFQVIYRVLRNRTGDDSRFLSGSMAALLAFFFRLLGFVLFLISVASVILLIHTVVSSSWNSVPLFLANIYPCIFYAFIFVMSILFGTVMIGSANEIERENDRNYIADVFSGITGFVALIIAIIALYKQLYP